MPKSSNKIFIGIDIGGTKILTAAFSHKFKKLGFIKEKAEFNQGEKKFFEIIHESIKSLLKDIDFKMNDVAAIGIGCAGMIEYPKGFVKLSPNIQFLTQYPLAAKMKKIYNKTTFVENDVNAGLYGEFCFGAAKGYDNVVGVFPGTGVGGAIIIDGKLYRGHGGAAGEIGHMFLNLEGLTFDSRYIGTLEALIGRLTIAAEAGKLAAQQKAKHLYQEAGTDINKIKSKVIARSLEKHDKEIQRLITRKAQILGLGMANLANILNPELFVLGGGLIDAMGDWIIPTTQKTFYKMAMSPNTDGVHIKRSELSDLAVAMGAAKLAQEMWEDHRS